jgi:hypothetical protein
MARIEESILTEHEQSMDIILFSLTSVYHDTPLRWASVYILYDPQDRSDEDYLPLSFT